MQVLPINQIICGNNVDVLATFPDDCIDLTVTSPPYDNLRTYKGFNFDFEGVAKQLYRVTKTGGVVVWVVGDATINGSETGTSFKQALRFMEIGFRLHDTMIYEKNSPANPASNRYSQIFEYMFVLGVGVPAIFNCIKDKKNRWAGHTPWGVSTTRQKDGTLTARSQKAVAEFGARHNIWRYTVGKGFNSQDEIAYDHPAIFPEKLAHDHIISWSNEGDIVLDPFSGSGTTTKMAKEANRKYIGIDCSEEYCEIARKRLTYDIDIAQDAQNLSPNDFNDLII